MYMRCKATLIHNYSIVNSGIRQWHGIVRRHSISSALFSVIGAAQCQYYHSVSVLLFDVIGAAGSHSVSWFSDVVTSDEIMKYYR